MSSFNANTTPNFDNLLLQTLTGRFPIRYPTTNPLLLNNSPPFINNQTLEDLLLDSLKLSDDDDNDDHLSDNPTKSQLAKEESKLEKDIIKIILTHKTDSLKPNSGQAVTIGEHHICVGFHEETGSDYRVWEWHGHIMLFDDEDGYTPEYIYGNYFERITVKPASQAAVIAKEDEEDEEEEEEQPKEEKVGSLGGLKELIDLADSSTSRILHRNISTPRTCESSNI